MVGRGVGSGVDRRGGLWVCKCRGTGVDQVDDVYEYDVRDRRGGLGEYVGWGGGN